MKKEEIIALFKSYEEAVCLIDNTECWSARSLCTLFGYTQWRNFSNVIEKAKESCKNAGQSVADHFANVSKTIAMPKGAEKNKQLHKTINNLLITFQSSKIVCQKIAIPLIAIYPLMGESLFYDNK